MCFCFCGGPRFAASRKHATHVWGGWVVIDSRHCPVSIRGPPDLVDWRSSPPELQRQVWEVVRPPPLPLHSELANAVVANWPNLEVVGERFANLLFPKTIPTAGGTTTPARRTFSHRWRAPSATSPKAACASAQSPAGAEVHKRRCEAAQARGLKDQPPAPPPPPPPLQFPMMTAQGANLMSRQGVRALARQLLFGRVAPRPRSKLD